MNYRELELSPSQGLMFKVAVTAMGLAIGWLFYDKAALGLLIILAWKPLEKKYKALLIEKRKGALLIQFKDLLYSLSTAVATGRSIGQGLTESIDFWQGTYSKEDYIIKELTAMTLAMEQSNMSDMDVLRDFALRSGLEDAEDLAMLCQTCKKTGADLTMALTGASEIIGDKITMERELAAIMSQKKFEGRIVAMAPFAIVLLIKLLSPAYLLPLTVTSAGQVVSTIALGLMASGWILAERVNDIEV